MGYYYYTNNQKSKGSKKKLENYRGIFITSILSKILEKLTQLRIKNKITEYSSPFQAGGAPNRSTADNLFLLRGIIDHTIYLNTSMHLTFYDFKQCFDSIWLKELMNCMWDAGVRNGLFYLIYLLNKSTNITVRTPFGQTEESTGLKNTALIQELRWFSKNKPTCFCRRHSRSK